MTLNQIRYHELQETKRRNQAQEKETNRANLATEFETNRANVAREKNNALNLLETKRSNVARETETHRSNVEKEIDADKDRIVKWVDTGTKVGSTISNAIRDLFVQPKVQKETAAISAVTKGMQKGSNFTDILGTLRDGSELANAIVDLFSK